MTVCHLDTYFLYITYQVASVDVKVASYFQDSKGYQHKYPT